jgi:drug/metabolite transporter (DMT)-like permease/heme-degrading monooxygenase HmoA
VPTSPDAPAPPDARAAGAPRPRRALVLAAYAAVYLVWGSTYLAIRYGVATLPPFGMAAVRFLLAGALLYGWARLRGAPRPSARAWGAAAVAGALLLLVGNGGVTWAEQRVPSGLAALLVATEPLWIVLLAWWRPGAARRGPRPGRWTAAGLLLGLLGVGVLVAPGAARGGGAAGGVDALAALVVLLAALAWAAGSLWSASGPGRARLPASAPLATGMQMLAGGALLALASAAAGEPAAFRPGLVAPASVAALGYLAVFGSVVAFSAYTWLLGVEPPARVATYAFVNPVVAVLLGWAVAGEALTGRVAAAGALIVGAVVLLTRRPSAARADAPAAAAARAADPVPAPPVAVPPAPAPPPRIARVWHGRTRADEADAYLAFLRARAVPDYAAVPGNRGVVVLRRVEGGEAHFHTVTFWESEAAVGAFAGDDVTRARYYPEDARYLLEREPRATHYEVVDPAGAPGERRVSAGCARRARGGVRRRAARAPVPWLHPPASL